ncbi:MAG: hypothetical protein KDA73_09620 [Rhodobacteraceae bacterium]|nr:hypothetical protein [Paracoccaceae bacterium]
MASTVIVPLTGVRLDPEGGLLRDYTLPAEHRTENYLSRYDRLTVVYDCVWSEAMKAHVLNAPPFLNLWEPFRASLTRDGAPVRDLRRIRYERCEQLVVPGPRGQLGCTLGGQSFAIETREPQAAPLAGLNAVLALNFNNRLEWIADWARFYVARHGAEAAVIVDNGSTDYGCDEIAATLAGIDGLRHAVIYSAPFPYGPISGGPKGFVSAKFFQMAMLNTARRDALARAAAVLSVDIDEIVDGPEGRTVFEAARRHPLGMLTIKGYYAYPERPDMIPARHGAHRFRADPNRQCNRKWCLVPSRLFGRAFRWHPHQIGGILQNAFTEQNAFFHNHCYGCTTGWKAKRLDFDVTLKRDPGLDALMDRYFPAVES